MRTNRYNIIALICLVFPLTGFGQAVYDDSVMAVKVKSYMVSFLAQSRARGLFIAPHGQTPGELHYKFDVDSLFLKGDSLTRFKGEAFRDLILNWVLSDSAVFYPHVFMAMFPFLSKDSLFEWGFNVPPNFHPMHRSMKRRLYDVLLVSMLPGKGTVATDGHIAVELNTDANVTTVKGPQYTFFVENMVIIIYDHVLERKPKPIIVTVKTPQGDVIFPFDPASTYFKRRFGNFFHEQRNSRLLPGNIRS